MATPQLSPGVLVREVDLTIGRADNVLDNIGAIAGPFEIGPVDEPIDITTEEDLVNSRLQSVMNRFRPLLDRAIPKHGNKLTHVTVFWFYFYN